MTEKIKEIERTIDLISVHLKNHESYITEQKKLSNNHLLLFQEVLSNLAKDREEFKKYRKNLKCLMLTVQILIGSSLLFAFFVLFYIFRI